MLDIVTLEHESIVLLFFMTKNNKHEHFTFQSFFFSIKAYKIFMYRKSKFNLICLCDFFPEIFLKEYAPQLGLSTGYFLIL